ncbi:MULTISPECIES: heterocyst formation ABC transporter subunit HepA [unclassified Moorena]|uniref:heterocyst formation ABC transporter subunit HepA n=1 Tax=unclassified Moorena TaxID=2683338 RepID=UPI0013BD15A4|nr:MULTISPECIES: heterocyst formation ABC transporter subunit HepA [unclassified Moorena]NEP32215.1 ABC transporter ATP-binding protein [Moorena sp. SIO3B2]NER88535.1 ABC transporter ATP-binding protein [Moorena sp. SIO3A2]NES83857.1 ABC transporter ATP-binding protein [Moorena sp. SIO2B7]
MSILYKIAEFKLIDSVIRFTKSTKLWQDKHFILREFKYLKQAAFFAIALTIIASLFEGFGLGFILNFLQNITDPNATPIQTGINWFDIWFLGVNRPVNERIYRISAIIMLTTWLRSAFMFGGRRYSKITQMNLLDRLRKKLFEQLQRLSLSYFSHSRSGELVYSLTTELEKINQAFDVTAFLFTRVSLLVVYVTSMFLLSWQLSIASLMLFSLMSVGLSNLVKRVRETSFDVSKAGSNFTSVAVEFINGIRTVKAFASQDFERRRFYNASENVANITIKSASFAYAIEPIGESVATTILIGMIIVAFTIFVPNGQMQAASLLTFLFVLFRLIPIIRLINNARGRLGEFTGPMNNIKELLRTDNKPYLQNGNVQFSGLQRAIEFASVDFGYDPSNLVLHDITLTINKGETTALVGASGSGKTTLADLIPRFYDPTAGKIIIDGIDIQEFEINSVRRKLAIVSQDTFIFNTSVRNNIAYGSEQADELAIREAAKLANALDFILDLPDGFDTQLGDRGVRLSGGQRQRLAIARALLRAPEILILDEATSALDSVSERLIQESLEKLAVGRTVITIAHRLSTISKADKVVVLEQGRIVEQGKYQELLEKRGKLWKYHKMQHEVGQTN